MKIQEDVIRALREAFALRGSVVSEDEVVQVAMESLRRTGRSCLRYLRGKTATYQTDDLMIEAALVLFGKEPRFFESEKHFENWAWQVARRLHMAHWQRKLRLKRGGDFTHIPIADVDPADASTVMDVDVLALHEALVELDRTEPELVSVVTVRFLLGNSVLETAELLGMSEKTVRRKSDAAKAWLRSVL